MGESACLIRSFSHPSSSSREAKEGDPIRALGESISFGRFMSESLAWEKWSAFSHNRYLEEVEKFSKPGSVAQKKAYFEAHYKRKAAEKAAAMLEEANSAAIIASEAQTEDKNSTGGSSMDSELVKENGHAIANEQQRKDIINDDIISSYPIVCDSPLEESVKESAEVKEAGSPIQQDNNVENLTAGEFSDRLENDEEKSKIVANQEKEAVATKIVASASKRRLVDSSPKLVSQGRPPKLLSCPPKEAPRMLSSCRKVDTPKSRKPAGDMLKRERLTTKSLHMSISLAPHSGETRKATLFSPHTGRRVDSSSLIISKDSSTPRKATIVASVNGLLKQSSVKTQQEDRRIKAVPTKSPSEGIAEDKKPKSLSAECSKSSNANGSKLRSSIVSFPFNFRSEERAAKRKEFFQKLEEKADAKESERKQLQTRYKVRADHDLKKMRQSTGFNPKYSEDYYRGSQLPSNHVKKIPAARPQSPKVERKPVTSHNQNLSSVPPRPSTNIDSSKRLRGETKSRTAQSVTSLRKNKAHENASPNIQS